MSDLERIGDDLPEVLRRMGLPGPDAAERVIEDWDSLAGDPWSARARPAGVRNGVLHVVASDGATATLLRYRSRELLERLADALGAGVVTSVTVTVDTHRMDR